MLPNFVFQGSKVSKRLIIEIAGFRFTTSILRRKAPHRGCALITCRGSVVGEMDGFDGHNELYFRPNWDTNLDGTVLHCLGCCAVSRSIMGEDDLICDECAEKSKK